MTAAQVQATLRKLANTDIATQSQRFFKTGAGEYGEGDRFLGIRVPQIRAQVKRHRDLTLAQISCLLRSAFHEERLFALLALVDRYARGSDRERDNVYALYLRSTRHIDNWDLVDSSASQIVGAHLAGRERDVLYTLCDSTSLWERRIAIIATLFFIRQGDFVDALALCERVLADPQDLIHKASGWMLREIGKRDPAREIAFLQRHCRSMPRTMLRYAIEKFPPAQRRALLAGEVCSHRTGVYPPAAMRHNTFVHPAEKCMPAYFAQPALVAAPGVPLVRTARA